MANIISFPFRLGPNGRVVTVDQDSEQADREQISVLALTQVGERPLAPGYGITDPAFAGVLAAEVAAGVAAYGPAVSIRDVITTVESDRQVVEVLFE